MESIQNWIQKQEVTDCINSLFISTDNKSWDNVRSCFAEEVLFDMSSLGAGAPAKIKADQIIEGWKNGLKDIPHIHHQAGNYVIRINKKEAEAFCYGIALHHRTGSESPNTHIFVGTYDFHLVQTEKGWKTDLFRFNLKFTGGLSVL